ncbi:hypothetical protein ScalyP_jg4720 [Parmales sp. scaly parma]|nr:hypothetical protein ScalyP_jg4720 [Parmales sp. scaly parma]
MSMSKEAMLTAQIEALKKAILKKDDDLKKQNEELFEVQTTLKCVESESVRASSGQLKSLTAQLRNSELMVKKATGEKQRLNSMLSKERKIRATQTAQTMPTSSSLLTQASQLPRGTNMTHMSHMSHLSHLTHTLTNVCETSATTTTTTTTSATINAESSCSRGGELLWESAEENATAQSSSYSSSLALRTYTAILGLHANEWSVADFVLQVVDNIVAAVLEGGMLVGVLLEVLGECVSGGEGMRVLEEVFRLGDEDTMDEDEDSVLEPVCEFAPEAVHKRIAGCFGGGENGSNVNNRQLTVDDVMRVMGLDVNSNSNYKGKAKALVRSLCKIFGGDDSDHSSNSSIDDINCSNSIARATSFLVEFTSRWNRKAAQFRVFEPLIRVLARGGVGATPTPFLMKAKVSVLQCLLLNEFLFSKFEVTRFVEGVVQGKYYEQDSELEVTTSATDSSLDLILQLTRLLNAIVVHYGGGEKRPNLFHELNLDLLTPSLISTLQFTTSRILGDCVPNPNPNLNLARSVVIAIFTFLDSVISLPMADPLPILLGGIEREKFISNCWLVQTGEILDLEGEGGNVRDVVNRLLQASYEEGEEDEEEDEDEEEEEEEEDEDEEESE